MEIAKYLFITVITMVTVWGASTLFSDAIKTHEIIEPEKGVKCVIVSRMFNTSVDCWMVE